MPTRSSVNSLSRDHSSSTSGSMPNSPVAHPKDESLAPQDPFIKKSSETADESPSSSSSRTSPAVPSAPRTDSPEPTEKNNSYSSTAIDLSLPEGITLPKSVDRNFFSQKRLRTSFFELPPPQMIAALEEYDAAIRSKGGTVRNPQAYFFGVVKRYLSLIKTTNGKESSDNVSPNTPMGETLSTPVKERLDNLINSKFCSPNDLNGSVIEKMKMLSTEDALLAIDEISDMNPDSIRNFPSYFVGILNRYNKGEGAREKKKEKTSNHREDRDHDRGRSRRDRDRRERSRDERDDSRRGKDQTHRRSPDRRHRRRRYSRDMSRSRSRDRYDSYSSDEEYERRERRRRRRSGDRSRSRSRSGSRSRSRYDRDRDDDYDDRRRRRSREDDYGDRRPSSRRSHDYDYRRDRNEKDSYRNQRRSHRDGSPYSGRTDSMSGMAGHYQGPPMGMPHGYSVPPPPMQQAPSMHLPPAPPPGYVNGPPPQYTPGQQHSSNGYSHSSGPMPPSQSGSYQQHMSGGGGAPNSNYVMNSQSQQQSHHNSGYSGSMNSGSSWQAPPDILGLAEQAKQAIQHINEPHHHKGESSQMNSDQLTVSSLPVMVQYAIKNLEATGYLDKELTGTCLRILSKLPESIALQSLEKFSSCDTSIMRNKEAYLAGILKKAINS